VARAGALLARARGERPVVCLVDEIFRGTNHEESVSAATAVVDALARHALVVVSSHNLVLGSLLADALVPWRIVRGRDGLMLEPGVLGRTNGVALLAEHGFDAAVQRKAEQVAGWLAGRRQPEPGSDPKSGQFPKIGV
jgi:DNA mismatch repair ATPase MutS